MVSSRALFYGDEKTKKLINIDELERPISIQIFGNNPSVMASVAKEMGNKGDIIDINMGCPAPKIVKNGDGSKLLLDLELVGKIVKEVVEASEVPVTVKIRAGWNQDNIVAVEAARIIEESGASAITIHGRTRDQYYGGKVDLDIIKKVKESVKIPVIGNGDIKTGNDARKMFEYTNVDGIMIRKGSFRESLGAKRNNYLLGNRKGRRNRCFGRKMESYKRTLSDGSRRKRRIYSYKRNEKTYMLVYKKFKRVEPNEAEYKSFRDI